MANISNEFVGVVHARNKAGDLVILRAGDPVPTDVQVVADLVDATTATVKEAKGGKPTANTTDGGGK